MIDVRNFGIRLDDDTLQFRRHFAAPVERVWAALVTPEDLFAWLAPAANVDARVGGAFELRFTDDDRMEGRILEFEANRRLVLAWCEGRFESIVTFELAQSTTGGTDFTLTHRHIRAGEQMIGLGAGWHAHVEALEAVVLGGDLPDREALYERLRPDYERRLTA